MKPNEVHECKKMEIRPIGNFDVSEILGAPFPVVLNSGIHEKFCVDCERPLGHIIEKPKELIAAVAILRSFTPVKFTGADIKFLRKSLGLRSKELAKEISVSSETLSRFENDKQPISEAYEKLLRAAVCLRHVEEARGLDVDVEGLFSLEIPSVRLTDDWFGLRMEMVELASSSCQKKSIGAGISENKITWHQNDDRKAAC